MLLQVMITVRACCVGTDCRHVSGKRDCTIQDCPSDDDTLHTIADDAQITRVDDHKANHMRHSVGRSEASYARLSG